MASIDKSLICPICKDFSEQPHQLHYGGGPACFSCRAFFRRAHQTTKNPGFKCKKDNKCEVTVKTRRKCQKCRYDLCISLGMRPDAVLTSDQKKVRFRNSIKKKTAKKKSGEFIQDDNPWSEEDDDQDTVVSHESNSLEDMAEDYPRPKRLCTYTPSPPADDFGPEPKKMKLEKQEIVDVENIRETFSQQFRFRLDQAQDPPCPIGTKLVHTLMDSFMVSHDQLQLDPNFAHDLISFHKGFCGKLRHADFMSFLKSLCKQFLHFALIHVEFNELKKDDQRKLLARNTPLFVQYLLARYFTGKTGYEQLSWLLGNHMPEMTYEDKASLQKVSVQRFNRHLHLFTEGADLSTYTEFLQRLHVPSIGFKCTAVWCHIILYQSDNTMTFKDPNLIHELCSDAMNILPHSAKLMKCTEKPNAPGMIFTAEAMAHFFAQNVIWNHDTSPEMYQHMLDSPVSDFSSITLKFSQDEEAWLQQQMKNVDEAFVMVPLSEELCKEFIMFNYDVPLSKSFIPSSLRTFNQRYLMVLKSHPEFLALTPSQQDKLWRQNSLFGTALTVVRLETCQTGNQQFDIAVAHNSDPWFESIVNGRPMKKLTMMSANKFTGLIPMHILENFNQLIKRIGDVIKDPETCRLMKLVLLFSGVDDIPSLHKTRMNYLSAMQRRNFEFFDKNSDQNTVLSSTLGEYVTSRINACVCDIKELTMILQKIIH